MITEAKGINGAIQIFETHVAITRQGLGAWASHGRIGDKSIPMSDISSVQFRRGGWFSNGFIRLTFSGGNAGTGTVKDAAKDENAIVFRKGANAAFEAAKRAIEAQIFKR